MIGTYWYALFISIVETMDIFLINQLVIGELWLEFDLSALDPLYINKQHRYIL